MTTSSSITTKKLQRLKSQLYISDNSDNDEFHLDVMDHEPARHTRNLERIDYNENKRVPLYVTTPSASRAAAAAAAAAASTQERGHPASSIVSNGPADHTFNRPEHNHTPLPESDSTDSYSLTDLDSNLIDINYLKHVVQYDLNKKLSVLGTSGLRSNDPLPTVTMNYDDSYIEEDETTDTATTTPPPLPPAPPLPFAKSSIPEPPSSSQQAIQPHSKFTDETNSEIKAKYHSISMAIVRNKQRKINSTIASIDKELQLVKSKYSTFKHHISTLRKRATQPKYRSKTIGSTVRNLTHRPEIYPEVFSPQFKETEHQIKIQASKMAYLLDSNSIAKATNDRIIRDRHVHSFNENRESFKSFLRNKIKSLDDAIQSNSPNTISDLASQIDWFETKKLVDNAQLKLNLENADDNPNHSYNSNPTDISE